MVQKTWVLTDASRNTFEADFSLPPGAAGQGVSAKRRTLRGGRREGVDTIEIDNGKFRFVVVPSRGMGLWKAWLGNIELGWKSPVHGPVHPQFVPITDPSGLGWLEGFDELLCRCGLESNGAPDLGPNGVYRYPLHGRIANLPASRVEVAADPASGEIGVTGVTEEGRFLFQKLELTTTYSTKAGQSGLKIVDVVKNVSGDPAEMQMLYHVNFGPPILDPGAKVVAPVVTCVPRDPRAAEGIANWESYPNEAAGFKEQVYFFDLAADSAGMTQVLLTNAHASAGVSLRYNKQQLPCFTLWKNTPMAADGYVTGLEPGTNYPNPRSFETERGRVVKLAPGASVRFEVEFEVHGDASSVSNAEQAIAKLQGSTKPKIFDKPQAGWTRV